MPTPEVYGPVNKAIETSKLLGALDPSSIWALIAFVLMVFTGWRERNRMKSDREWQDIRMKGVEASLNQATATARLADELGNFSDDLHELRTIVDERLQKGGNHV